jgi:hypothetical protein
LSTVPQQQWVNKLFGYDFAIKYCPGRLNTVTDALSQWADDAAHLSALIGPSFKIFEDLRQELQDHDDLHALRDSVVADRGTPWRLMDGLILRGTHVFMPAMSATLPTVLQLVHTAGHEGM